MESRRLKKDWIYRPLNTCSRDACASGDKKVPTPACFHSARASGRKDRCWHCYYRQNCQWDMNLVSHKVSGASVLICLVFKPSHIRSIPSPSRRGFRACGAALRWSVPRVSGFTVLPCCFRWTELIIIAHRSAARDQSNSYYVLQVQ